MAELPSQQPELPLVAPATNVLCQICGQPVEPTTADDIFQHVMAGCAAMLVNGRGEAIDYLYYVASDGNIYAVPQEQPAAPPVPPEDVVTEQDDEPVEEGALPDLPTVPEPTKRKRKKGKKAKDILIPLMPDPTITTVEEGMKYVFERYGQERLGGASGDLGWSSFSVYQRCPYLFKVMYLDGLKREAFPAKALEIGSCIHAFAAVDYQRQIDPEYPITSQILYEGLLEHGCDGERVMESWRVYQGYMLRYENDYLVPLAVEYHVADPKTRESARYDLVAKVLEAQPQIPKGTYVVEHKSASRFTDDVIDGWRNDGEIIGQMMLWNRLKLTKQFGKLAGVIVNLIGKQKVQQRFERVVITPQRWQLTQHTKDLRIWQGQRMLAMATKVYPRARANCIHRYGKCPLWDHCAEKGK